MPFRWLPFFSPISRRARGIRAPEFPMPAGRSRPEERSWEFRENISDLLARQAGRISARGQNREPSEGISEDARLAGWRPRRDQDDMTGFNAGVERVSGAELQFLPNGPGDDNLTLGGNACFHGKTILPLSWALFHICGELGLVCEGREKARGRTRQDAGLKARRYKGLNTEKAAGLADSRCATREMLHFCAGPFG